MSENVGASTSRNPKGLHGLYGDNFTFTYAMKTYVGKYSSTILSLNTRWRRVANLKFRPLYPGEIDPVPIK
jgi:hypothetical protein